MCCGGRGSLDAVRVSTGDRVSPGSALEEKSPYHLVNGIYSSLPALGTGGAAEERGSCLRTIKPVLKHPLFLECCVASVVIGRSVKWDKDKTKSVSWMPESVLALRSLLTDGKRVRTDCGGEEMIVNFSSSPFPLAFSGRFLNPRNFRP